MQYAVLPKEIYQKIFIAMGGWSGLRVVASPTVALEDPLWNSPHNTAAPFYVHLHF